MKINAITFENVPYKETRCVFTILSFFSYFCARNHLTAIDVLMKMTCSCADDEIRLQFRLRNHCQMLSVSEFGVTTGMLLIICKCLLFLFASMLIMIYAI